MSAPVRIAQPPDAFRDDGPHPNELDLRRIARLLGKRSRYRYVAANVIPVERGYLVTSPCCSRSISAVGHSIDIALIQYDEPTGDWMLFNKIHEMNEWRLQIRNASLQAMMDYLNDDPGRQFWQ